MKIYYQQSKSAWFTPPKLPDESNLLSLSYNNFDDFDYKTTLNARFYFDGKYLDFSFQIKILIDGVDFSASKLNELRNAGWDGFFPIPGLTYISLPTDIQFYPILLGKLGFKDALNVLEQLCDASLLVYKRTDDTAITLSETEGFAKSLQREAGEKKAFADGWRALEDDPNTVVSDFRLNVQGRDLTTTHINFRFNSDILPYDINVLIGPNGIGKSFFLKSLANFWLGIEEGTQIALEESGHIPFDHYPNISKLILVSYSPFEEFALNIDKENIQNKKAYRYFGFRLYKKNIKPKENLKIDISRNLPAVDSIKSLFKALEEDSKFSFMPTWTSKFKVIKDVLNPHVGCDMLALKVKGSKLKNLTPILSFQSFDSEGEHYIQIDDVFSDTENNEIPAFIDETKGVVFFKKDKIIPLSSGLRLFSYIVINVVGEIKQNSLVVIDEPELFLHPTLEIAFISLLKKVLKAFSSKSILATHSLATVREVPSACVHVMRTSEDFGLNIAKPPFETFGGDMQRISSYVFGDDSVSKPFDSWLVDKLKEYGDGESLIKALGSQINEEMLISIMNDGELSGS